MNIKSASEGMMEVFVRAEKSCVMDMTRKMATSAEANVRESRLSGAAAIASVAVAFGVGVGGARPIRGYVEQPTELSLSVWISPPNTTGAASTATHSGGEVAPSPGGSPRTARFQVRRPCT
ncbi:hypothetical protein [Microbacterium arborescens]|uniref:hypothetical protein n=1 Tax=Microbacterium arborescens TaxID=33883 RepID=UPI0027849934|nr:hypothetical protein [Microbacterium arborescens]MDQ1218295.1 hypothetical protein [Microbacterium arborescens]